MFVYPKLLRPVCSDYVSLAKRMMMRPHLVGFANGVLRSAAKAAQEGTLPDPEVRSGFGGLGFWSF